MKTGIFFAFLSVLLGAFAAHGLKTKVSVEDLAIWHTASQYQFYHALALILFALWKKQNGISKNSVALLFIFGIIIFSGSLYLLVLTQNRQWGMITPIGGLLFMAGWTFWFFQVYCVKK